MARARLGPRADARAPHESRARPSSAGARAKVPALIKESVQLCTKAADQNARDTLLCAPSLPQRTPEAVFVPHALANLAVPLPVMSAAAAQAWAPPPAPIATSGMLAYPAMRRRRQLRQPLPVLLRHRPHQATRALKPTRCGSSRTFGGDSKRSSICGVSAAGHYLSICSF